MGSSRIQYFPLRFGASAVLFAAQGRILSENSNAAAALFPPSSPALAFLQGAAEDYRRANDLPANYRGKLRRFRPSIRWTDAGDAIHWRDEDGTYVRVEVTSGERRSSADPSALDLAPFDGLLQPQDGWRRSQNGGEATSITFRNTFDRPLRVFWVEPSGSLRAYGEVPPRGEFDMDTYAGHAWVLDFSKDDLAGIFVAADGDGVGIVDETSRRLAMTKVDDTAPPKPANQPRYGIEPRGERELVGVDRTRSHPGKGEGPRSRRFVLATDRSERQRYGGRFHWSPNGHFALGFRESVVDERKIPLVDSAPDDRVQPRLDTIRYRKPGDELPQRVPRLFDLKAQRSIPIDEALFQDSWSVRFERWSPDSRRVYVRYHERGHQRIVIRSIDVETGAVTEVIDERSGTFIDYSQKGWIHWIESADEVLWASERDGWNHIYRIDAVTGEVKNQITKGPWVVRKVERVDEAQDRLWLTIMGFREGEDPYHKHLARVDLDGSNLMLLTEGDGTHEWTMGPDGATFIDRWSRVDQPTVTELRNASSGELIARLGQDDATDLYAAGFTPPERFTAPGRDGKTSIYGHIIRPSNHDPKGTYPVIEAIYAGPHGFHVPKRFGLQTSLRRMADLGFIVVQIDGMGTNWRSKAFHDVAWRNLKDAGFPDRIAWMRAAAKRDPSMDLTRVGIYGGSAGGQNALAALLHHGDFYRAAAADCGCHDNRMDKIWWNEAWMGRMGPHYEANSNVTHAHRLTGDLFLTVGELDRNVDPASTLQVVDALIKANKDFEFVMVPGAGHGVGESPYLFRRRQDFFVRSLWDREPRAD